MVKRIIILLCISVAPLILYCQNNNNIVFYTETNGSSLTVKKNDEGKVIFQFEAESDLLVPSSGLDSNYFIVDFNDVKKEHYELYFGWHLDQMELDFSLDFDTIKAGTHFIHEIDMSKIASVESLRIGVCYVVDKNKFERVLKNPTFITFYICMHYFSINLYSEELIFWK